MERQPQEQQLVHAWEGEGDVPLLSLSMYLSIRLSAIPQEGQPAGHWACHIPLLGGAVCVLYLRKASAMDRLHRDLVRT